MHFVLLSLLLFSYQGNAATIEENDLEHHVKEQENLLKEVKDWFLETINTLRDEIQNGVNEVRNLQNALRENGKSEIQDCYEVSKNQLNLMSLPPDCVSLGEEQLEDLLNTNIEGFLECPNVTLAAKDAVAIGFEAARLTAQLLLTADEWMNGFGTCWSWNPFKFIWCSFEWIKGLIVQSFSSIKVIKQFMSKVADLIKDIKAQYDYCVNESKGLADVHTFNVMNQVHKCTLKGDRKF